MADYTFAQLEGLWIQAGGPAAVAPIAAAIALAESSGNPQAINPTDNNGTQTSWGLWQISNGTHNMPVANILDPRVNAQQAVAKYKTSGWAPWGTYATGAYTKFLPKGYVAPSSTSPQGVTGPAATTDSFISDIEDPFHLIYGIGADIGKLVTNPVGIATSVTSIAQDFAGLSKMLNTMLNDALWLFKPSNWIRVVCFVLGVMALLPGVYMLSRAGSGGDVQLAVGILLVMVAGMLLWVAFHSLSQEATGLKIDSLGSLLGYISGKVRANSPATTG
jgi:hypothetical protein